MIPYNSIFQHDLTRAPPNSISRDTSEMVEYPFMLSSNRERSKETALNTNDFSLADSLKNLAFL